MILLQLVSGHTVLVDYFKWNVIIGNGVDYDSGPYNIVFPRGATNVPFNIPITNDDDFEATESFKILIKDDSLPAGIKLGEYNEATVTIYN